MSIGTIVLLMAIAGIIAFAVLRGSRPKVAPAPKPIPDLPKDNPPIAYAPGLPGGTTHVTIGDPLALDLCHRQLGCDISGNYTLEYGAYDPEGKILEYFIEAEGPSPDGSSRIDYAVFNDYGERIDGRWLTPGSQDTFAVDRKGPFNKELEAIARCKVFVGKDNDEPPYAMKGCAPEPKDYICPSCGYKAILATQMTPSCAKCGKPMEVVVEKLRDVLGTMTFRYSVRDGANTVDAPVQEFTVHRQCGVRAKKAK